MKYTSFIFVVLILGGLYVLFTSERPEIPCNAVETSPGIYEIRQASLGMRNMPNEIIVCPS